MQTIIILMSFIYLDYITYVGYETYLSQSINEFSNLMYRSVVKMLISIIYILLFLVIHFIV